MLESFCNLFFWEIVYFGDVITNKRGQGGYDHIRIPVLDSSVRVSIYRQGVLIPTYTMDRVSLWMPSLPILCIILTLTWQISHTSTLN